MLPDNSHEQIPCPINFETLCVRKKEDTTNTQEPANRKFHLYTKKIQIIKQLTDMKVAPSNSNITTGTCSCKVAITHTYRVDNDNAEPSIDVESTTISIKNLDKTKNQQSKEILESYILIISTKRTKKRGSRQENNKKRKKRQYGQKTKWMSPHGRS